MGDGYIGNKNGEIENLTPEQLNSFLTPRVIEISNNSIPLGFSLRGKNICLKRIELNKVFEIGKEADLIIGILDDYLESISSLPKFTLESDKEQYYKNQQDKYDSVISKCRDLFAKVLVYDDNVAIEADDVFKNTDINFIASVLLQARNKIYGTSPSETPFLIQLKKS